MAKGKSYDIDIKRPYEPLVDLIGFQTKPGNRIKDYLKSHGILELSLRDLIDLFLPPASNTYVTEDNFWLSIPILRQPQFGPCLYDSALLSLTEAELAMHSGQSGCYVFILLNGMNCGTGLQIKGFIRLLGRIDFRI